MPGQSRATQNPPGSGGNTPISFRPNVNRAKTKRWVEAKSVSYDGGDWGDEDSEEEEEEPGPPPPPYLSQRTASSELSSRRLSGIADSPRSKPSTEDTPFSASPVVSTPFNAPAQPTVAGSDAPTVDASGAASDTAAPAVGLPEVKRLSGFGADFLGGSSDLSSEQPPSIPEQESTLHHNNSQASQESQGFTSVVHQAFDVPETPNSTAPTVSRTNSDGTSGVSPIINRSFEDRTPTIPEEPTESTPTDTLNGGPQFIPGHRRDLSLPHPDNDPSKRPVVMDNQAPSAAHAEVAATTPSVQIPPSEQPMNNASSTSPEKDFVAPLKFGSSGQPSTEGYRGNIPTIIPAGGSADPSPQDTDNDRLREEIMRSLSREGSEEPEPISQPQVETSKEEIVANQAATPLDGPTGPNIAETPRPLDSSSQDPYASPKPRAMSLLLLHSLGPKCLPNHGLREDSLGTAAAAPDDSDLAPRDPPPAVNDFNQAPLEDRKELPQSDDEGSEAPAVERPRLSIVPPVPEDETKLKGFREILQFAAPHQRIKAFEETRSQFATLDTGLNRWIQITVQAHPEHRDVVEQSQSLASAPLRTLLPEPGSRN
ncbi:hypothetical protein N7470_005008 [Penicillium chermesinum]|nr:hypothetical protein N7470_005008 [Penicillium chermesinum]